MTRPGGHPRTPNTLSTVVSAMRAGIDMAVLVRLGGATVLALASGSLAAIAPLILNWLIDAVADSAAAGSAPAIAIAYIGALAGARMADQVQTYLFATGDQRFQRRLGAASFSRILHLPMRTHFEQTAGGLLQTLSLGQQGARVWLTHTLFSLLPVLAQLVFMLVITAAVFGAWMAAIILLSILVYGIVFTIGVRRLAGPTRAVADAQVSSSALLADSLANVEPVKAFGAEVIVEHAYEDVLCAAEARWRTFHRRRFENAVGIVLAFSLMMGSLLAAGLAAAASGTLTVGAFVLLNTYASQIARPVEMTGLAIRDLAQGATYLARWASLMSLNGEDLGSGEATAPPARPPAHIRFEAVSFAYPGAPAILSDVTIDIPAGSVVAIVGRSGAGKTTLLRLLQRQYEPTAGKITIDGQPVASLALRDLRSRIAVVSQETFLLNASLASNIRLARPDASDEDVFQTVSMVSLEALVSRLPLGLETVVGQGGQTISGGERQRVAIARALLRNASVLVLDEATSALDGATEQKIIDALLRARARRTTLIVTHRASLAALADEIVVLGDGGIAERGRHADLMQRDGAYAHLWRRASAAAHSDAD